MQKRYNSYELQIQSSREIVGLYFKFQNNY